MKFMSDSGIKVIMNISINGAEPVSFDSVSATQLMEVRKNWGERVGRAVSGHIAQHDADKRALLKSPI